MSHRLLVKDSNGERELLLIDKIVVGRDPRCDISEPDGQLSRRHAEFAVSERGVVVRDLNSRNGMLVNGRKVLEAVLHPGDVVQVAGLAVTFLRASAPPEVVSMPAPPNAATRPAPPPFRLPLDDDKTGLMTPDQVAAAAVASLSERRGRAGDRQRTTADGSTQPATVRGAATAAPGDQAYQAPGATREPAPLASPPAAPASASPALSVPPALGNQSGVPITGVTDAGWTASLTWQVATLAVVAFLIGAVSALPWRAAPLGSAGLTAATVLLVPLVALLAALGLGLFVAAHLRRGTLARLSALAGDVRQAVEGASDGVRDPLGTGPSGELVAAINEALARARRPCDTDGRG